MLGILPPDDLKQFVNVIHKDPSFKYAFFFFGKKIGAELTSVAHLPLFCMWDAAIAQIAEWYIGPYPGSEPRDTRLWKQSMRT